MERDIETMERQEERERERKSGHFLEEPVQTSS